MRTFYYSTFLILGLLIFFIGCSDDDSSNLDFKPHQELNDSQVCGYEHYTSTDQDKIVKRQEVFDEPAIGWSCDVARLTISIDPCFDTLPVYLTAITDAVAMYNAIPNCGVVITIVPTGGDMHLDCFSEACVSGGILGGTAEQFYDGDDSTNSLLININAAAMTTCCGAPFVLCDITGLIAHEIGHVIGLAHTGSGDGNHIPGTLVNDAASLLNGGSLCAGICAFSPDDILALQTLYPPCGCIDDVFLRGPIDLCIEEGIETGTVTYCVSPMPPGTSLFEVDGTPINGNCFDFTYDQLGTYTAEIQICVDATGCCRTLSRTVVVFDDNCCSTCYCECEERVDNVPFDGSVKKFNKYRTVRHEIPCWDDTPCSELYPIGDEYFNCERIIVDNDLDFTITGDDVLCWDVEGEFCINGLEPGTGVDWIIYGPNGSFSRSTSGSCLYITFSEIGTYTVTAEICVGECCQVFSHTVEYKNCEEICYCVCEEGDGEGNYETVQLPIDCEEDCSEQYPVGDEYFDCYKIRVDG